MDRDLAMLSSVVAIALFAAASPNTRPARGEPLYFALELRRDGALIAKPKLLGETGLPIHVDKRRTGEPKSSYQLSLLPFYSAEKSFELEVDASTQGVRGHSKLHLSHGEEKTVELGRLPGELQVVVLLMRVESAEFRALMGTSPVAQRSPAGSI